MESHVGRNESSRLRHHTQKRNTQCNQYRFSLISKRRISTHKFSIGSSTSPTTSDVIRNVMNLRRDDTRPGNRTRHRMSASSSRFAISLPSPRRCKTHLFTVLVRYDRTLRSPRVSSQDDPSVEQTADNGRSSRRRFRKMQVLPG